MILSKCPKLDEVLSVGVCCRLVELEGSQNFDNELTVHRVSHGKQTVPSSNFDKVMDFLIQTYFFKALPINHMTLAELLMEELFLSLLVLLY